MKKIVINTCYGGFGLSQNAIMRYGELARINIVCINDEKSPFWNMYYVDGIEDDEHWFSDGQLERDDPHLVRVVEELGNAANHDYAQLKVVEIPDDVEFQVEEYDGMEWVAEKHRVWR